VDSVPAGGRPMSRVKKCVIVAPYWRQPGHLGCLRVARYVRWLNGLGIEMVVLRAGSDDRVETTDWGREVTIRDPIGFYRDLPEGVHQALPLRRRSRLRRVIAYLLLVPDPLALWSHRAARHPLALEHVGGARWVLSSSPPESVHLAAEGFARRFGAQFVMDLRDGWLDEPTIPLVRTSRVQRLRHRRLERRLVGRADRILVTSESWRRLLVNRLPDTAGKTAVLTNACPVGSASCESSNAAGRPDDAEITLLYAGKVTSSRVERRMAHLFECLETGLRDCSARGQLVFVGNLDDEERRQLRYWHGRLGEHGWRVEVEPPVDHDRALAMMRGADGLLLLSSSMASIPAKLFDYLAAGRPILAVAPAGSEVWKIGRRVPQVSLADFNDRTTFGEVSRFFERCRESTGGFEVPEEFLDDHVQDLFLRAVDTR